MTSSSNNEVEGKSDDNVVGGQQRHTGTVVKWLNLRGIGFIAPNDDGPSKSEITKDLIVHYSEIKQGSATDFKSLREGSEVEFEISEDPKYPGRTDMRMATKVTAIGGGDCECRIRRTEKRGNRGGKNIHRSNGGGGGGGNGPYPRRRGNRTSGGGGEGGANGGGGRSSKTAEGEEKRDLLPRN